MLPREADLTVNKYLSRDDNTRARYLYNGPNRVPWKEGPALLSRAGFFNDIEKRSVKKNGIQLKKYDKNLNFWYYNDLEDLNDNVITINDINDDSFTLRTTSSSILTFNLTLTSGNNFTTSTTYYTSPLYDDYGISSNKISKYEDIDGVFDNGLQSMFKHLSHEPVWDTSEYKHRYQIICDNYDNDDKFIPWKEIHLLDYLIKGLDYFDISPGEIPWRTDIKQDESLYDIILDKLKYERFIPWQAEEDFEELNGFRGRTNLSTFSFRPGTNQWFNLNDNNTINVDLNRAMEEIRIRQVHNERELDTHLVNEAIIDDAFEDSPIVHMA